MPMKMNKSNYFVNSIIFDDIYPMACVIENLHVTIGKMQVIEEEKKNHCTRQYTLSYFIICVRVCELTRWVFKMYTFFFLFIGNHNQSYHLNRFSLTLACSIPREIPVYFQFRPHLNPPFNMSLVSHFDPPVNNRLLMMAKKVFVRFVFFF